jgi:hypothetical protein
MFSMMSISPLLGRGLVDISAEHPERRPDSLAAWDLYSCFEFAYLAVKVFLVESRAEVYSRVTPLVPEYDSLMALITSIPSA